MEKEVGGGFRVRNTCIPVADSCHVWQNQYNIAKKKKKKEKKYKNMGKLETFKHCWCFMFGNLDMHSGDI